jgi:hypothetical protein
VDFSEARDLFGIIFQIPGPKCKFLDSGLILKKPWGPNAKCPKLDFPRIVFLKENPWTKSTCPWTTGARPTGTPVHETSPRLHEKDEEFARVRSRASPEVEERRGGRATAV